MLLSETSNQVSVINNKSIECAHNNSDITVLAFYDGLNGYLVIPLENEKFQLYGDVEWEHPYYYFHE